MESEHCTKEVQPEVLKESSNDEEDPSSQTQGLLAGTMRYFWAKVYLKSWRAPGNLFLPNQFQKWSNSVPLIGQKNIFLPSQP